MFSKLTRSVSFFLFSSQGIPLFSVVVFSLFGDLSSMLWRKNYDMILEFHCLDNTEIYHTRILELFIVYLFLFSFVVVMFHQLLLSSSPPTLSGLAAVPGGGGQLAVIKIFFKKNERKRKWMNGNLDKENGM